eukprot:324995-Rhodomonas_salina.1
MLSSYTLTKTMLSSHGASSADLSCRTTRGLEASQACAGALFSRWCVPASALSTYALPTHCPLLA